jgi:acyl-CoA thioesterase-1
MKIACLGDSLTAGYNVRREDSWVALLNQETEHTWLNAGISGDTSTGILLRLQTEAFPQNPDAVLWMAGDNDIMLTGSCSEAKSCVMSMIHQCTARGIKPVIGIQFPCLGIPERWKKVCDWQQAMAESQRYIQWLRCLTEAISLRRVDFATAFETHGGKALYQGDLMHPNVMGHRVMADAVRQSGVFHHI